MAADGIGDALDRFDSPLNASSSVNDNDKVD